MQERLLHQAEPRPFQAPEGKVGAMTRLHNVLIHTYNSHPMQYTPPHLPCTWRDDKRLAGWITSWQWKGRTLPTQCFTPERRHKDRREVEIRRGGCHLPLHNRVGMALLATHHKTSRRESLTFSSFTKHPNPWLMTEHYVALKLQFNATDNASDLNQPIHLVLWILPTMWVPHPF